MKIRYVYFVRWRKQHKKRSQAASAFLSESTPLINFSCPSFSQNTLAYEHELETCLLTMVGCLLDQSKFLSLPPLSYANQKNRRLAMYFICQPQTLLSLSLLHSSLGWLAGATKHNSPTNTNKLWPLLLLPPSQQTQTGHPVGSLFLSFLRFNRLISFRFAPFPNGHGARKPCSQISNKRFPVAPPHSTPQLPLLSSSPFILHLKRIVHCSLSSCHLYAKKKPTKTTLIVCSLFFFFSTSLPHVDVYFGMLPTWLLTFTLSQVVLPSTTPKISFLHLLKWASSRHIVAHVTASSLLVASLS